MGGVGIIREGIPTLEIDSFLYPFAVSSRETAPTPAPENNPSPLIAARPFGPPLPLLAALLAAPCTRLGVKR